MTPARDASASIFGILPTLEQKKGLNAQEGIEKASLHGKGSLNWRRISCVSVGKINKSVKGNAEQGIAFFVNSKELQSKLLDERSGLYYNNFIK